MGIYLKQILMAGIGICSGFFVAVSVFIVMIMLGLIPRFAAKTHTGKEVYWYEEVVAFAVIISGNLSVYDSLQFPLQGALGTILLIAYGVFSGMFVGSLALTLAELLKGIPILARRGHFMKGATQIIWAVAIGKMCGSLFYFAYNMK